MCVCFLLVGKALSFFSRDTHPFNEMLGYFICAEATYALTAATSYLSRASAATAPDWAQFGKLPLAV